MRVEGTAPKIKRHYDVTCFHLICISFPPSPDIAECGDQIQKDKNEGAMINCKLWDAAPAMLFTLFVTVGTGGWWTTQHYMENSAPCDSAVDVAYVVAPSSSDITVGPI